MGVCCFKQAMPVSGMLYPGIVACSQVIGAQGACFLKEEAKLYMLVAGNAGIGSPSLLVFLAEVVNNTELKFLL